MTEKTLLFTPKRKAFFKKSPLYAAPLFAKTMALSSRYLLHSFSKKVNVKSTDEYIDMFWRLQFESCFTSLYATGREQLNPEETYVFMSNHESWMDIPAMFGAVRSSLRMVSKESLMRIPIFGHALKNAGFIAIDRQNRVLAIRQLDEAKKRLSEGISIWIAPEGTRTRDGQIGRFKKGGFYLARDLSLPIVPVFIEGAAHVMPADSVVIKPNQSITVHFCKPIEADEVNALKMNELVEKVRLAIIAKQKECGLLMGDEV